jgi:hypothetical protein
MTTTTGDTTIIVSVDNALWRWFYDRYNSIDFAGTGRMLDFGSADEAGTPLHAMRLGFRLLVESYKTGWRPASHEDAARLLNDLIPSAYSRTDYRFVTAMAAVFEENQTAIINMIESIPVEGSEPTNAGTSTSPAVTFPDRSWTDEKTERRGYAVDKESGRILSYRSINPVSMTVASTNGDLACETLTPIWPDDVIVMHLPCTQASGVDVGQVMTYARWGSADLLYIEDDNHDASESAYVHIDTVRWVSGLERADVIDATRVIGGVEYVRKDVVDYDLDVLSKTFIRASRRENLCGVYDATVNVANRRMSYLKVDQRVRDRLVTVVETYEVTRTVRASGAESDTHARDIALSMLRDVRLADEIGEGVTFRGAPSRRSQSIIEVTGA